MEDRKVVHELHVAFFQLERDGVLGGREVQGIERFGLGFCQRREMREARGEG